MTRYVGLQQAKDWLRITHDNDNSMIDPLIAAACEAIDDHCGGRSFEPAGTVASTRYFAADCSTYIAVDDIGSLTDLVIAVDLDFDGTYETTWTATDYQVAPINHLAKGMPVMGLQVRRGGAQRFPVSNEALVAVTARWGWPATPQRVEQACLQQVARWHSRRSSPLGAIQAPELGGAERLPSKLDADVQVLLHGLHRNWFGVPI